jgi:hypothetical protein
MAYTHHELKLKTIAELRDIAKDITHDAVKGYTQLNKEHLLVALCQALSIPIHDHHDVVGLDKGTVKAKIHALKALRAEAIEQGDHAKLKAIRRQRHRLNHQIRSHLA